MRKKIHIQIKVSQQIKKQIKIKENNKVKQIFSINLITLNTAK